MLVAPADLKRLSDETRAMGIVEVMGEAPNTKDGESPTKRKQRRPPPIAMTTDVGMGGPSLPTGGRGLHGSKSKEGNVSRMPTVSDGMSSGNGTGTPRNAKVGPTCGSEAEALLNEAQETAARRRDAHPSPLDLASLDLLYEGSSSYGASECMAPANRRHLGNVAYYFHLGSASSRFVWGRFSDSGRSIILGRNGQVCSGVTEFLAAAKNSMAESPKSGAVLHVDAPLEKIDTQTDTGANDRGELMPSVPG